MTEQTINELKESLYLSGIGIIDSQIFKPKPEVTVYDSKSPIETVKERITSAYTKLKNKITER